MVSLTEEEFADIHSDQKQASCTGPGFKNFGTATRFQCLLVCDDFQSLRLLTKRDLRKVTENWDLLKSTQEIQVFIKMVWGYQIFYTVYVTAVPALNGVIFQRVGFNLGIL